MIDVFPGAADVGIGTSRAVEHPNLEEPSDQCVPEGIGGTAGERRGVPQYDDPVVHFSRSSIVLTVFIVVRGVMGSMSSGGDTRRTRGMGRMKEMLFGVKQSLPTRRPRPVGRT